LSTKLFSNMQYAYNIKCTYNISNIPILYLCILLELNCVFNSFKYKCILLIIGIIILIGLQNSKYFYDGTFL
jgi:hypothetical protein